MMILRFKGLAKSGRKVKGWSADGNKGGHRSLTGNLDALGVRLRRECKGGASYRPARPGIPTFKPDDLDPMMKLFEASYTQAEEAPRAVQSGIGVLIEKSTNHWPNGLKWHETIPQGISQC